MPRSSKFLIVTIVTVFVLACNFLAQPFQGGSNPTETPPAAIRDTPPANPDEDLVTEVDTPSAEDIEQVGSMLDPQGTPVEEWKGIPVMPQATAGQEFAEESTYSFKVNAPVKEVYDFYKEKLIALGWEEPYPKPIEGDSANIVFVKGTSVLSVTVVFFADQGFSVVWLISI